MTNFTEELPEFSTSTVCEPGEAIEGSPLSEHHLRDLAVYLLCAVFDEHHIRDAS
jgi:hypothetical protein